MRCLQGTASSSASFEVRRLGQSSSVHSALHKTAEQSPLRAVAQGSSKGESFGESLTTTPDVARLER